MNPCKINPVIFAPGRVGTVYVLIYDSTENQWWNPTEGAWTDWDGDEAHQIEALPVDGPAAGLWRFPLPYQPASATGFVEFPYIAREILIVPVVRRIAGEVQEGDEYLTPLRGRIQNGGLRLGT
jgi:hypothetical protein